AHGSVVFTRGETQALVVTTLRTASDEQRLDNIEGASSKNFMLHYNFPPFCVGEARFSPGPGRREIGHGALAERAVRAVLPAKEDFPYTVRIVSEILESNGSSSMASVCGGSLSLMNAGVPITGAVAGIAMGLVLGENGKTAILSDITGQEDHLGDMDFKVAGTKKGITALQMDIKISGITKELLSEALAQAKRGRLHILGKMDEAMSTHKAEMSAYAPRIVVVSIRPEKVRDLIGPGGKVIRSIIDETGASINIEDDGTVSVASTDREASARAIELINSITQDPEIGRIYTGKVKKVMDFGAFVEIIPGKDGLVHISQLADHRVTNVTDVVNEGDVIDVKILDIDGQGKIKLSLKDAKK
ncbi:MAG: polyribonucleotide nucleotidyltransferase, partial [Nitrospinota bacterium]